VSYLRRFIAKKINELAWIVQFLYQLIDFLKKAAKPAKVYPLVAANLT
jgi:hypothetical protein